MILRPPLAFALTVLIGSTTGAVAQTSTVDEGSFRLAVRGSTIGTETFSIQRSGAGANATVLAQGRIVLDTGEQTRTVLQMQGNTLRPSAYQIEVSGDNGQRITGRAAGNRFRATIVSSSGEQMREYLVNEEAVILDDGVAHHHYFIAERIDGSGSVPVILPRQSRQVTATVRDQGAEPIQVADRQVTGRRLSIEISGLDSRTIWVDDDNRVLRLQIPDQDLIAVRTSLP